MRIEKKKQYENNNTNNECDGERQNNNKKKKKRKITNKVVWIDTCKLCAFLYYEYPFMYRYFMI